MKIANKLFIFTFSIMLLVSQFTLQYSHNYESTSSHTYGDIKILKIVSINPFTPNTFNENFEEENSESEIEFKQVYIEIKLYSQFIEDKVTTKKNKSLKSTVLNAIWKPPQIQLLS